MTYTTNLNKVLLMSRQEAERLGSTHITPDHLLLGLIRFGKGRGYDLLKEAGLNMEKAKAALEERQKEAFPVAGVLAYDKQTERILRILDLEART